MTVERRESIKRKIRALLAKTTASGCTEAEAAKSAALAGQLMAEYDLTYEEVHVRQQSYGARARPNFVGGSQRRRSFHEVRMCVPDIAAFFDCRSFWMLQDNGALVFYGTEWDTEAAHLMTDMIRLTMDSEFAVYLRQHRGRNGKHGKSLRASFLTGMGLRLNQRLAEIKEARKATMANAGRNALVVIKSELVTQAYAAFMDGMGGMPKTDKQRRKATDAHAYYSGKAAGDRVGLIQERVDAQRTIRHDTDN